MLKQHATLRGGTSFERRRRQALKKYKGERLTKAGQVQYVTDHYVVVVRDVDRKLHAFPIRQLKGYAGEEPTEIGLVTGADVTLDVVGDAIESAVLSE